MKKHHVDYQKGSAKIEIEHPDDLWILSQIIEPKDHVSGKTFRKIKVGGEDDRKSSISKKPVYLSIEVEKVQFESSTLRVLGVITQGPDDIPKGEHHSFSFESGSTLTIEKTWSIYQKQKLSESFDAIPSSILLVAFDREEATFAQLIREGYTILTHLKGDVAKKDMQEVIKGNFYQEIIKALQQYEDRYHFEHIILGSPAFWKDELLKELKDNPLLKKIITATCSTTGKAGITELLKRDEIKTALSSDRTTQEIHFVEQLMSAISKNSKAAYGISEVEQAVNQGASHIVLVSESYVKELREQGGYERLENLLKTAQQLKSSIHFISSSHEGGKKLEGLGGIGALLRYDLA